jgi:hypothetical protein
MLSPVYFHFTKVLKLIESSRVSFIYKFSKDSGLHLKQLLDSLLSEKSLIDYCGKMLKYLYDNCVYRSWI